MSGASSRGVGESDDDFVRSWGVIDADRNRVHVVKHPDVMPVGQRKCQAEPGTRDDLRGRNDCRTSADRSSNRRAERGMDQGGGMLGFAIEADDRPLAVRGDVLGGYTQLSQCTTCQFGGQPWCRVDERREILDPPTRIRIANDGSRNRPTRGDAESLVEDHAGLFVGGAPLSDIERCITVSLVGHGREGTLFAMSRRWKNWAGNQTAAPNQWLSPDSEDEVGAVVSDAVRRGRKVKVVGSGHSFTATAVADDVLVDLSRLKQVDQVDAARGVVRVGAGVSIADLNIALETQGWALANLGDIAYQSIAGAISTSTHGTGAGLTGLADQVAALTLIDGRGCRRRLDESDGEAFRAAQVSVGSLGVITSVEMRVVPAFVLQAVEAPMRLDRVLGSLDDLVSGNDHFEFYWIPHTRWTLTKRNNRSEAPAEPLSAVKKWWQKSFLENTAFGALCRMGRSFPSAIPRLATALPSSGTVTFSDASHRVFASQRRVRFVEMEYAIPRAACAEALNRIVDMVERRGHRVSFPVEVRFTAPDRPLLSTAHGRDSAYIAVHMYKGTPFEAYFRDVEAVMADYAGRPHWGKMHYLDGARLSDLYPGWSTFLGVRQEFDPDGVFVNGYVRRIFGLRG